MPQEPRSKKYACRYDYNCMHLSPYQIHLSHLEFPKSNRRVHDSRVVHDIKQDTSIVILTVPAFHRFGPIPLYQVSTLHGPKHIQATKIPHIFPPKSKSPLNMWDLIAENQLGCPQQEASSRGGWWQPRPAVVASSMWKSSTCSRENPIRCRVCEKLKWHILKVRMVRWEWLKMEASVGEPIKDFYIMLEFCQYFDVNFCTASHTTRQTSPTNSFNSSFPEIFIGKLLHSYLNLNFSQYEVPNPLDHALRLPWCHQCFPSSHLYVLNLHTCSSREKMKTCQELS